MMLQELKQAIDANSIKLPSMPDVALKVNDLVNRDASIKRIAEVIKLDPALSVRVLQVSNSAIFGRIVPSSSVDLAITKLGLVLVKNLVYAFSVKDKFRSNDPDISKYLKDKWHFNLQVAAMATLIAKMLDVKNVDGVFLAGMIHNIGVLPISEWVANSGNSTLKKSLMDDILISESKELSVKMMTDWNFPSDMITVTQHYDDENYASRKIDITDTIIMAHTFLMIRSGHYAPDSLSSFMTKKGLSVTFDDLENIYVSKHQLINNLIAILE
jgi:HD-like signal output (HDOD) protein